MGFYLLFHVATCLDQSAKSHFHPKERVATTPTRILQAYTGQAFWFRW